MERFLTLKESCKQLLQVVPCAYTTVNRASWNEFSKKEDENVNKKNKETEENKMKEIEEVLLEPPTNCCMSGCSNCVWISYAENLANLTKDGGEQAMKLIEKNVKDPSLKAFLLTELRMRDLSHHK